MNTHHEKEEGSMADFENLVTETRNLLQTFKASAVQVSSDACRSRLLDLGWTYDQLARESEFVIKKLTIECNKIAEDTFKSVFESASKDLPYEEAYEVFIAPYREAGVRAANAANLKNIAENN
jgi:hypothetical protein